MQKTLVALFALVALTLAQFPVPSGSFGGTASFGVQTQTFLTSFITVAGQTTSSTTVNLASTITSGGLTSLAALGLSVNFNVAASASGNVTVFLNQYVGGGLSTLNGFQSSGAAGGAAGGAVNTYFGFTYFTNLTAGTFTFNAVITPTAAATTTLSSNLQLFYAVNATDGSNQAYSSGSVGTNNFFGALPSTVQTTGTVVNSITFTLPPVAYAVVVAANVNLAVGATANTPAIFPVLFNTTARVAANARNVYVFSSSFALSLLNTAATTIRTTFNAAYNANVGLTAGASTTVATSGNVNGVTYSSSNTFYSGVAYNVSVAQQAGLASTLVQNTSALAIGAGRRFVWAFFNETTGTAQILTDSVYNSAQATVSVSVTHFSNYAVYSTNADDSAASSSTTSANQGSQTTTNQVNPTGGAVATNTRSGSSALCASAAVVLAAVALML